MLLIIDLCTMTLALARSHNPASILLTNIQKYIIVYELLVMIDLFQLTRSQDSGLQESRTRAIVQLDLKKAYVYEMM